MAGDSLLTRYRPASWKQVLGQDATVSAMQTAIKRDSGRAFLLVGPSGTGKTTLARIAAREVGCEPENIIEVDAATNTGIDDMRGVIDKLVYRPIGGGSKAVIVDEVHALSKQAWTSLLKSIEEPPSWAYWFLCTTETAKVPQTVMTRCLRFEMKLVSSRILEELLWDIASQEKLSLGEDSEPIVALCAKEADGSPRQAIANLGICMAAKTRKEAAEMLRTAAEAPEAIELARALVRRANWGEVQAILADMKEVNPESVRHVIRAYMTKVVLGARTSDDAGRALEVLDVFSHPYHPNEGMSPLVLACGRLLLS